ncbi:MAG: phosphotransferase, partial [Syntrophobacteraceae bacterium]|nr:phosphotransferase [Syntrophobacteraceae bacterium]
MEVPAYVQDLMTTIPIEMAGLLGKRTAELHCALSSDSEEPGFSPEPFSVLWQRSIYQSMQSLTKRVFRLLRNNLQKLPADAGRDAAAVLEKQKQIVELMRAVTRKKLAVNKIRIHGDYHLGQVLYTGKDFVMIDFEGEPARTLSERRLKRSPLRDVAGMLRSFHYAASLSLLKEASLRPEDRPFLQPWADAWYRCVAGAFLRSYLEGVEGTGIVPKRKEDTEVLLKAFVLEKAVYELGYELNNRPEWVVIPMRGIMHLLHEHRNRT